MAGPELQGRQRRPQGWMVEWLVFDGGEWFPQFRVGHQENMYKGFASYGVEGVSLLGWKLSGIEHNVRAICPSSVGIRRCAADFYRTTFVAFTASLPSDRQSL